MHLSSDPPHLLPPPREMDFAAGRVEVPELLSVASVDFELGTHYPRLVNADASNAEVRCAINESPGASPEAYSLQIRPETPSIRIDAASPSALRHALHTLSQLLKQYGRSLPCLTIRDQPAFAKRGVMLDISRDRVPTMEHLKYLIDLLASWKVNHLQLYTEHTFAYRGHEEVWRDASPLTPDEVQELDSWCAARGIELGANQNCFGHFERWLKHPRYKKLAETTGKWRFNRVPRSGGFSLCPVDPKSLKLVEDLLGQLLPNFRSRTVNIGCDETFDVGQGRSREAVAALGKARVFADYINRVAEVAEGLGFKAQFWADMALSHPGTLELLNPDLTALVWGYEPDSPFDEGCGELTGTGRAFWVCPGTSSWRSITGRTAERRGNLRAALKAGLSYGAKGIMITDWGDLGHRQQFPVSLLGLAEAAAAMWNPSAADDPDSAAVSLHAFECETGDPAAWLAELGDADLPLRCIFGKPAADGSPRPLRNASALFVDMHKPFGQRRGRRPDDELKSWQETFDRLDEFGRKFPYFKGILERELLHTLSIARFAAMRAIFRRSSQPLSRVERKLLSVWLENIIEEHRELWLKRSRPGGLEDSVGHYQGIR